MSENEYIQRQRVEQEAANLENVQYILLQTKAMVLALADLGKQVYKIREELRRLDTLKPLTGREPKNVEDYINDQLPKKTF